jgi:membrane-associated phospholipid phosphatase
MTPDLSGPTTFLPWRRTATPQARLAALAAVLLVAGLVVSNRSLNTSAFMTLQRLTALAPAPFWAAGSVLGLGLCAALLAALVADERMAPVATILWSLLIGGLALQLVKSIWALPRPLAVLPPESVNVIGLRLRAWSMPSGHAAMLAALACALAREARRRRRSLVPLVWLLGALGCIARVAVGAHWPASIGLLSVIAGDLLDARWSLRRWLSSPVGRRVFAVVQLIAAIFLLAMDTGYPSALAVQWLLGIASIVSAVARWRHAKRERFRTAVG